MPRAQLFEVEGINPPRRVSKLSLRYRRSIAALKTDNMPPRRPPSGRTTVNQNHPAATAAAAARVVAVSHNHPAATAAAASRVVAAGEINGVKFSAPATRESPSRRSKTVANEKISEMCHHNPRAAIAVEAPDDAQATAGVTVDYTDVGATGVTVLELVEAVVPAEIPLLVAALPPLWNAWWCGACTALYFVGDGGELIGPCLMCQVRSPIRKHVMLDPDELEELRRTPGLSYQSSGVAYSPPPLSRGVKTSGMSSPHDSSQDSSDVGSELGILFSGGEEDDDDDDDFEAEKTDQEVSKYSFYDRLEHYMERELIKEENHKSVELAIMVEAGANVREMGVMTKELCANWFHSEYVSIIAEIPDTRFEDDSLRASMQHRFKGMRKGEMSAENLLCKYESELTTLRRFAYKFPGVGNLSKLPSGTAQLQQLRRPLVAKLWVEKNPVRPIAVVQPDGTVTVEKYGDVDHQSKKAKVDGMRSVIDKNRIDAIMLQISVMRGLEEIYVGRMGRDEYERRLVNLANQMPGMMEQTPQGDDLFTP